VYVCTTASANRSTACGYCASTASTARSYSDGDTDGSAKREREQAADTAQSFGDIEVRFGFDRP